MKRILSVILIVQLLFSAALPVWAADAEEIKLLYSVFFDEMEDGSSVPYTLRMSGLDDGNRLTVTGGRMEMTSDGVGNPSIEFRTGKKAKNIMMNFSISIEDINSDVTLWMTDFSDNLSRVLLFTAKGYIKAADGNSLRVIGEYEKHKDMNFVLSFTPDGYSIVQDGTALGGQLTLPSKSAENIAVEWEKNIKSFKVDTYNQTGVSTRVTFGGFALYEGTEPRTDAEIKQYIIDEQIRLEEEAEKVPDPNAPEIYVNNDFNSFEEGETSFGIGADKKGNLMYVTEFPDEDNKSVCIESVNGENFFPLTTFDTAQKGQFIWDMSVYFADLESKVTMTMRDPQPIFLDTVQFLAGGQLRNVNGETIGTYQPNRWYRLQLVVDVANKKYSFYLDGQKIIDNLDLNSNLKSVGLVRFHIYAPSGGGSKLYIDNWRIYEGNELLSDEYLESMGSVAGGSHYESHTKMEQKFRGMTAFRTDAPYYYTNSKRIQFDETDRSVKTYGQGDEVMIPLRAWAESAGGTVTWADGKSVVQVGEKTAEITTDSKECVINGTAQTLATAPANLDGSMYIPAEAVAAMEGLAVQKYTDMVILGQADQPFDLTNDANYAREMGRYLLFDHPSEQEIMETLITRYPQNEHPRIMVEPGEFEQIKALTETDDQMAIWYESLINSADNMLTAAPIEYTPNNGDTLLESARTMLSRSRTLGLAYNLTGNEAYKDALWSNLETVCNFPDWYPTHFLDVGEMSMAVAIAYDWVYNDWTPEQRLFIETALENKGLLVTLEQFESDNQLGYWTVTDNNWNVVCNGGAAVAALAIGDRNPELCGKVVHYALWGLESMMKEFAPDGGWSEGVTYWQYTMSYFAQTMSALDTALGTDYGFMEAPGIEKTGEYVIQAQGPQGIFNYHDAGTAFYSSPEILFLSSKLNMPELTINNLYNRSIYDMGGGAAEMIWYDPDMNVEGMEPTVEKDSYFRGIETAFMRNDFEDANGIYVGLHGGRGNVNHGQLDKGTFIIDAIGQRWFLDLGSDSYSLPDFFGAKRNNYYRNRAEGHNTIVLNPSSGADQTPSAVATITKQFSKPRGAFSVLDLTPVYPDAEQMTRAMLLSEDRSIITLRDEIKLKKPSELYWFAHTKADIEILEDKKSALLTIGTKQMYVQMESDMDAEFTVMDPKPLPTSPQDAGQNANSGIQKLAIHLNNVTEGYIQVSFVPIMVAGEAPNKELIPPVTPIDQWESLIPDGEYAPLELDSITVDGEPVADFDPSNSIYKQKYEFGRTEIPQVEATSQNYDVTVEQATSLPGTATIRVTDPADARRNKIYLVEFSIVPQIGVTPEGSHEAALTGVLASDVPQPENPAESSMDGDLNTRWSAFGVQWIQYDLGAVYDVTHVGLAWMNGDQRTYPFEISVSEDGENFVNLLSGESTSTSNEVEVHQVPQTKARYVRVKCFGNSVNDWCSLTEAKVYVKD